LPMGRTSEHGDGMLVTRIASVDDPRLHEYRNVADGELLRQRGLFVAEGRLVVERLLETSHPLKSLLVNDAALASLRDRLERISRDVPVYVAGGPELLSIVGFHLHRGCLALAERPRELRVEEVVKDSKLLLVLEGLTDADNVGSAFRNAAAFGVDAVLLSPGCCDPLYRKAIRTSMGSSLRVPFARVPGWPSDLGVLKDSGFLLVALTPSASAIDIASVSSPDRPVALLVGSEGPGLSPALERVADLSVRIPMKAGVDSLNVATATGIALHRLALIP
jgi:tRNA G18 (ribose-2'-O)-methylase SpoU